MDSFSVSGSGQTVYTTLNAGSSEGSEDDESMRDDSAAPDRVIFVQILYIVTSINPRLTISL